MTLVTLSSVIKRPLTEHVFRLVRSGTLLSRLARVRNFSNSVIAYCFTLFEADLDNFLVYICTRRSAHDHFLTLISVRPAEHFFFSPIRNQQFRPGFTVSLCCAHSQICFGSSELRRFSFHHDLSFVFLVRFSARPIGDSLVPLGSCSQLFELRNSGRSVYLPKVYVAMYEGTRSTFVCTKVLSEVLSYFRIYFRAFVRKYESTKVLSYFRKYNRVAQR